MSQRALALTAITTRRCCRWPRPPPTDHRAGDGEVQQSDPHRRRSLCRDAVCTVDLSQVSFVAGARFIPPASTGGHAHKRDRWEGIAPRRLEHYLLQAAQAHCEALSCVFRY
jgi:hypothetical protein